MAIRVLTTIPDRVTDRDPDTDRLFGPSAVLVGALRVVHTGLPSPFYPHTLGIQTVSSWDGLWTVVVPVGEYTAGPSWAHHRNVSDDYVVLEHLVLLHLQSQDLIDDGETVPQALTAALIDERVMST